ncbi:hypothetical protein, partial [Falsiroseomonas oryzae]|uniref:hypothetical protein n=1 Tax=Falsiroseomonas oryzae TaxID=2766473 RepID=UPI0022EADC62
ARRDAAARAGRGWRLGALPEIRHERALAPALAARPTRNPARAGRCRQDAAVTAGPYEKECLSKIILINHKLRYILRLCQFLYSTVPKVNGALR